MNRGEKNKEVGDDGEGRVWGEGKSLGVERRQSERVLIISASFSLHFCSVANSLTTFTYKFIHPLNHILMRLYLCIDDF